MITAKDLQKILDTLLPYVATKEDLRKQTEEIDEKLVSFKSNILSHVDAVYKEVLAFRQEETIHAYTHARQDDLESISSTP